MTGRVDETILLSVMVAAEGAHAFSAFMPSYFTVKKFAQGEADRVRLRSGYLPAVALNLALGGSVSLMIRDRRPILASLLVAASMIALYENAIR